MKDLKSHVDPKILLHDCIMDDSFPIEEAIPLVQKKKIFQLK